MPNPLPSLTSPPWSPRTKRTVVLIALAIMFYFALQIVSAWSVVLIAAVLAYLLYPLTHLIENSLLSSIKSKSIRRNFTVLLTFVVVFTLFGLTIFLIFPPVISQMQDFAEDLPNFIEDAEGQVVAQLKTPIRFGDQKIVPWNEIRNLTGNDTPLLINSDFMSSVRDAASVLSTPVVDFASLAVNFLISFFFMVVMLFYLVRDGETFIQNAINILPIEYQGDAQRLIYELGRIWNAYLRGQLLLSVIVGLQTGIATAILGLPQPLVLGLLAALFEFIPNLGPIIAAIPAMFFALLTSSTTIPGLSGLPFLLVVIGAYVFIQQTETAIIVPRVMGSSLHLHPFAVVVAVISGAALAGLLGIILAAPVMATLRLVAVYIWGKLLDIDPFQVKLSPQPRTATSLPPRVPAALADPRGEIVEE